MRYILVVLVILVIIPATSIGETKHKNTLRDLIHDTPLDLWAGKPNRPYEVISEIQSGGEESTQGVYDYVRNVLNNITKQAINLKADAIINLTCTAKKYPHDNGDYFDKQPWVAIASQPMYCKGQAVKYKH